jgi:hypothetical protein
MRQPTKAQWKELYQAAIAFQQAAPWKWMANEDIFAVASPVNGEVGYCSILGNGGEEFGLGVFIGDAGLRRYAALVDEQEADDSAEAIMTHLLIFLLANRDELHEEDLKEIRSLGLSFRGKNAWPLFRSRRPGYAPWFLERDEAIHLAAALRQALEIANRVKVGDLDLRRNLTRGKIVTRYLAENGWQEEWRSLHLPSQDMGVSKEPLGAVDEARLHLLSNRVKERCGSWEFDIFVAPVHIGSAGSRPYHPLCFMAVERDYGLVVQTNMREPWLTASEKREEIIRLLEKSEVLPGEIRVRSQSIRAILEPIARALGIRLRVSRLRLVEEAKASLYEYLSHRRT